MPGWAAGSSSGPGWRPPQNAYNPAPPPPAPGTPPTGAAASLGARGGGGRGGEVGWRGVAGNAVQNNQNAYNPGAGTEGVLSGAGYNEDWYKTYGQDLMKTPSASEQLFQQGMAGSNPYYDYAQQEATKAINDASAARGNFNSSYTLKNIGNAVANLRGQQAKGLTDLAGQSDAARVGRYDFSAGAARSAQGSTEDRIRQVVGGTGDLARGRAGLVDNFYTKAGDLSNRANMAAIEAQLKEAGLSASEIQNIFNNVLQGAGVASKFV